MRHRTRRRILVGLLAVGIATAAYLLLVRVRREDRHITVGWKNSVEQSILAEIVIQRIERSLGPGLVLRHPTLAGTQAAHQALVVNAVDIYPEYTGTALVGVLHLPASNESLAVREQVKENYRTRFQIEWIGPLGFEATPGLATRRAFAERLKAPTIGALASSPQGFRLAASRDFEQCDCGLPLLARSYQLTLRGAPQLLDQAQAYTALNNLQVDAMAASATDGWLESGNYTLLADDKQAFPANEAGILVRSSTLEKFPSLGGVLNGLCGRLDASTMRRMNAAVALGKRRPAEVAAEFLKSAGL